MALKEINQGLVDYTAFYNEVMAMMADGYSEDMLATAFDHLCENEKVARGFLAKNARLRKLWLDDRLMWKIRRRPDVEDPTEAVTLVAVIKLLAVKIQPWATLTAVEYSGEGTEKVY
nr:hypothetical protein CFP56_33278 [Quercus suber]